MYKLTINSNSVLNMEINSADVLKGMMLLSSDLNPQANEWKPFVKRKSQQHLRGKRRLRDKRRQYYCQKDLCKCPEEKRIVGWSPDTYYCDICYKYNNGFQPEFWKRKVKSNRPDTFKQSISDYLNSDHFKSDLEEMARVLAFQTIEKPVWDKFKNKEIKAVFVLLVDSCYETDPISRPLSKYSRDGMIRYIDRNWKPTIVSKDLDICPICYDEMTDETPTIQLMCKHKLCTNCFLKCCQHNGDVIRDCPMCRARVRIS